MAEDESAWLPEPPPPRPARRDAAIEAALRRFDGAGDAAVRERPRRSWASTHRPQLAMALSAMLLVVVGVPAALIGLRDQAPTPETAPPAIAVRGGTPAPRSGTAPPAPTAPVPNEVAEAPTAPAPSIAAAEPATDALVASNEQPVAEAAPAERFAAAPPPPPPPPPPQPPPPPAPPAVARAEKSSGAVMAQDVVVTGTRIPQPSLELASPAAVVPDPSRAAFLSRLQSAVRADDRRAVIRLIAFPLRVNSQGRSRLYRDAKSVERDFGQIFTPEVRRAILGQRADQLFVRDQGTMIGDGEVWFDQTCPNASCAPAGPFRIIAVNR